MKIGNWLRNKINGDAVKITALEDEQITYSKNNRYGVMQISEMADHFDLIDDPVERADIEFLLRAKIEAGEAEIGLYDLDLSFVMVDKVLVDGKDTVTFQWFDSAIPFNDLLI